MKKTAVKLLIAGGALLLLFALLTVLLNVVDVLPVTIRGPRGSEPRASAVKNLGFAHINVKVFQIFGRVHVEWYVVTQILGYLCIAVAAAFALYGVVQLINRKSIKKVDPALLLLGGFYLIVIVFYLLFEVFAVNYRPIMPKGLPEPSYPSSHSMLSVFVMLSGMVMCHRYFGKKKTLTLILDCVALVVIGVTAAGRLVSGYHWFTDVAGGCLLALALFCLFFGAVLLVDEKTAAGKEKEKEDQKPAVHPGAVYPAD